MNERYKDDIYYVCTMIEYVARKTNNRRKDIIKKLSQKAIDRQLKIAAVNHCLSYEQVADEWIEEYGIEEGSYDTIKECKYSVPTVNSIGRVYQQLVLSTMKENETAQTIRAVFSSFISDEISNFNSNVYYSNPDYLKCSYEAGSLLA